MIIGCTEKHHRHERDWSEMNLEMNTLEHWLKWECCHQERHKEATHGWKVIEVERICIWTRALYQKNNDVIAQIWWSIRIVSIFEVCSSMIVELLLSISSSSVVVLMSFEVASSTVVRDEDETVSSSLSLIAFILVVHDCTQNFTTKKKLKRVSCLCFEEVRVLFACVLQEDEDAQHTHHDGIEKSSLTPLFSALSSTTNIFLLLFLF